jgi:prophage regulatory protein
MNILRRPEVMARTGLSGPTIWRLERAGQFPARVQLAPNSVGWFEADVDAWLASRCRVGTEPRGTLLDAG